MDYFRGLGVEKRRFALNAAFPAKINFFEIQWKIDDIITKMCRIYVGCESSGVESENVCSPSVQPGRRLRWGTWRFKTVASFALRIGSVPCRGCIWDCLWVKRVFEGFGESSLSTEEWLRAEVLAQVVASGGSGRFRRTWLTCCGGPQGGFGKEGGIEGSRRKALRSRDSVPVSAARTWTERRVLDGGALDGSDRSFACSYLVDPASSHMLVSKIKPCMSKYKHLYCETANGSLNQLSFIWLYLLLLG